ncbi:MAG TPA: A24 family peptidase [Ornithinibacter sp.]|nr:A24 family peptidase [Ornithinibacter sp.]
MTPWWVVLLVSLAMGVVGHLTGVRLATGGYRIDEDEAGHAPGRPWWPGLLTALLSALAAWAIGDLGAWAALPAYLLFAWLTVGLIWIDLDVHRLPVGLVVPTAAWLVGLLVVATVATGEQRWIGALVGAAVMGGVYLLLAVLPGGGVGGGDVRLAPVIGALLGWLSVAHVVVGLMAGFLVGGVAAIALLGLGRVGLKTSIAYGPAMCLGAWVAIGATSRILTWLGGG